MRTLARFLEHFSAFCILCTSLPAADAKPNILLIYSDDHGWADLGAQGVDKDIRTPNLDQLARDGVRFARGYVTAPQCVPSRAGVLTGRYQQKFGVEDNGKGPLPLAEQTIAERLEAKLKTWAATLQPPGPVTATLRVRAKQGGKSTIAWRTKEQKDFTAGNTAGFDWPTSADWQEVKVEWPAKGRLIHLRINPTRASSGLEVQSIALRGRSGGPRVWNFGGSK